MVSELFACCVYTVVKIIGSEVHAINPTCKGSPQFMGVKGNHKCDTILFSLYLFHVQILSIGLWNNGY